MLEAKQMYQHSKRNRKELKVVAMVRAGNMAAEKSPALYLPTEDSNYDDKSPKKKENKYCTKFVLLWLLASFVIALVVGLCVQFLFPFRERLRYDDKTDIDRVHAELFGKEEVSSIETTHKKGEDNDQWHLDFLINPTRLCDTLDADVQLLVIVPSAADHFEHRATIRKTWGAAAAKPHGPVRLAFVLGTTPNATQQSMISSESEQFGDVLQVDSGDTQLTHKSVLALRWVGERCAHARHVLKTDDDTFVNLPVLGKVLEGFDPKERFVGGWVHEGAAPVRTPSEKYFVSEADYPDAEYPPYASGSAYVTTGPLARELFDAASKAATVLPMEDVFVTGVCADQIGAELRHEPRFAFSRTPEDGCEWDDISSLATIHRMDPTEMSRVWQQMAHALRAALDSEDYSFDSFGGLSASDLFHDLAYAESESAFDDGDYYNSPGSESSDGLQRQLGSIYDVFNRLKKQIENQLNADLIQENSPYYFNRLRNRIQASQLDQRDDEASQQVESRVQSNSPYSFNRLQNQASQLDQRDDEASQQQVESRVQWALYAGDPGVEGPLALPLVNRGNLMASQGKKNSTEESPLSVYN